MSVAVRLHLLCSPLSSAAAVSCSELQQVNECCSATPSPLQPSSSASLHTPNLQSHIRIVVTVSYRRLQQVAVSWCVSQCDSNSSTASTQRSSFTATNLPRHVRIVVAVSHSELHLQLFDVCNSATATPLPPLYSAPLSSRKHPMSHLYCCAVRCSESQ